MAYTVSLTRPAEEDFYAAYEYLREAAPHHADAWLSGLFTALASLSELPLRCPLIPEAEELKHPARQLLYGKGKGTYRIIFDVQEASDEGPLVRVLRIWHGVRNIITAEDIGGDA